MTDLIEFLRARLDDDEQAARDRLPHVQFGEEPWRLTRWGSAAIMHGHRVLAEVDAKRRILNLCSGGAQFPDFDGGYESAWEEVLHLLALPYVDHPAYDPKWRP